MRKLKNGEIIILTALIGSDDPDQIGLNNLSSIEVEDMLDGGMGSIRIFPPGSHNYEHKFRKEWKTGQFKDEDGTIVLVSINLDQFGKAFELDIWKVDFLPLKRYPKLEEIITD